MVNVVVGRQKPIHVSANTINNVIETTGEVILKNNPILSSSNNIVVEATSITQLNDVVFANTITNNEILMVTYSNNEIVFSPANSAIAGSIDGGIF